MKIICVQCATNIGIILIPVLLYNIQWIWSKLQSNLQQLGNVFNMLLTVLKFNNVTLQQMNAINNVAAFDLPSTSYMSHGDSTSNIDHLMNMFLLNHAAINCISRHFESSVSGVNEDDTDYNTSVPTCDTDRSVHDALNALHQHILRNSLECNPNFLVRPALYFLMCCTSFNNLVQILCSFFYIQRHFVTKYHTIGGVTERQKLKKCKQQCQQKCHCKKNKKRFTADASQRSNNNRN